MAFLDFLRPKPAVKPLSFSEPIFIKENSSTKNQIEKLEKWKELIIPEQADRLAKDIKKLTSGLNGEKTVAYELKNSYLPILILQDLYLKNQDTTAQIDFVVIATSFILVIESKKLIDDIEVTNKGDFNRCFKTATGLVYKKEGMYNPVTQNQRHVDLLKRLLSEQMPALPVQDWDTLLQSVVVLANPKTVIQDANAPAEIRDKIIKHDQLINHLKKLQEANTGVLLSEQDMRAIADILVSAHQERPFTPPANYQFTVPLCPKCNVPMVRRTAKKGANQGNEFFGCPNFPKCRQIINID